MLTHQNSAGAKLTFFLFSVSSVHVFLSLWRWAWRKSNELFRSARSNKQGGNLEKLGGNTFIWVTRTKKGRIGGWPCLWVSQYYYFLMLKISMDNINRELAFLCFRTSFPEKWLENISISQPGECSWCQYQSTAKLVQNICSQLFLLQV